MALDYMENNSESFEDEDGEYDIEDDTDYEDDEDFDDEDEEN